MSSATSEPKWRLYWPIFLQRMEARLQRGHEEYGDQSFQLSHREIHDEILQEYEDVIGWGFIGWVKRMEELRGKGGA